MPKDEAPVSLPAQRDKLRTVITRRECTVEELPALDVQVLHVWVGQKLPSLLARQLVNGDLRERSGALTYR